MSIQLKNSVIVGDEIALAWGDGRENYIKLEDLRRACPCASCQGEPDVTGFVVRPSVTYRGDSFALLSHEFVGGYALQFTWKDGHRTGLYSFDLLRALGESSGS